MCSCNQYPCCCGGSTTTYTLQPMAELTGLVTEESTFIPVLTFGGGSTGMTGTFAGWYTRVGRMVWYKIFISLTAKGSSTGNATISGLPYTEYATNVYQYPANMVVAGGALTTAANTHGIAAILAGTSVIRILSVTDATNVLTTLTHAAFADTTILDIEGSYRVED